MRRVGATRTLKNSVFRKKGLILLLLLTWAVTIQAGNGFSQFTFRFTGFGFSPGLSESYGLVRAEMSVPLIFTGDPVEAMGGDCLLQAVLIGPGLDPNGVSLSQPVSDRFVVGGENLTLEGDYSIRNLRLVSVSGSTVPAQPSSVTLHVITQILSTSVETSRLSLGEMEDLGIQVGAGSYDGYQVTISLGLESGNQTISLPVIIPSSASGTAGWNVESGSALVEGVYLPLAGSGGRMGVGRIKVAGDGSDGGGGTTLPAIVYFPGNVGFLHNFFKAVVIVINTTPADANMDVSDLHAVLNLPPGPDGEAGTPEIPGDDPLRPARTAEGYVTDKLITNPGPDGELNTDDDTTTLHSGETGVTFLLVEGLQEGTHTVGFDLSGNLRVNGEDTQLTGSAAGKVLVRNPDLAVSFSHPDVVRSGMPYDMSVTVSNTSQVPANGVYLQFDSSAVLGGYFTDNNGDMMGVVHEAVTGSDGSNSLQPGETGRVTFHVMPTKTGKVVASYLQTENGTVSLKLEHGVDDRGVALSPDTIHLSRPFYSLPDNYRNALELVLGDALSVATTPILPFGVIRILGRAPDSSVDDPDEVAELAVQMMLSGLYVEQGEAIESVLIRNMVQLRNICPGVEQLFRGSYSGKAVQNEEALVLSGIRASSGDTGLMTELVQSLCDLPDIRVVLLSGLNNVELMEESTGLGATVEENTIPGTLMMPMDENRVLLLLPSGAGHFFRIRARTTGETVRALVSTSHGFVQAVKNDPSAGHLVDISLEPEITVRLDYDGNASLETTLSMGETPVSFPAPALIAVRQMDPELMPNGSLFGDELLTIFNRALDRGVLEDAARYQVDGIQVLGVKDQGDGRTVRLRLQKPIGHFVGHSLTVAPVVDRLGEYQVSTSAGITLSPLLRGFFLEGTLFDSDGNPVPDHRIDALVLLPNAEKRLFAFKTDDAGYFSLEQVTDTDEYPCETQLHVILDNKRRDVIVRGHYEGQRIRKDIHFTGTGTVKVMVLNGNHQPVPDAKVALNHQTELYEREAITDANGETLFEHVHVGPFTIHAVKQDSTGIMTGIGAGNLVRAGSEQDVTVFMEQKTGKINGRVIRETIDDNGQLLVVPLSGKMVVVFCEFNNTGGNSMNYGNISVYNGQGYIPVAWQFSGEDGGFRFEGVPAGRFLLQVWGENGLYNGTNTAFLLQEDEEKTLTLTQMDMSASVYGQVFDASGNPVEGVDVVAKSGNNPAVVAVTDATGGFDIAGLTGGPTTVSARKGALSANTSVMLAPDQSRVRVDLSFPPVGTIEGVVYDANGVPVPGAHVIIPPYNPNDVLMDPISGNIIPDPQHSTFADENGMFRFENQSTGTYTLTSHRGNRCAASQVTLRFAGETVHADLHWLPAGSVTGQVLQSDGVTGAVAKVTLRCNLPSRDPQSFGVIQISSMGTVITDGEGWFKFNQVNAGPVTITATNVFASETAHVETRLRDEGEDVPVSLRLGAQSRGRIMGRIYLPDGHSPAGAGIPVTIRGGGFPELSIITSVDGRFETPEILPPGTYVVLAVDPVTESAAMVRVQLAENGEALAKLRLRGFGSADITVIDSSGNPVKTGEWIFTEIRPDGGMDKRVEFFDTGDGIIRINRIFEGDFSIAVVASDGRAGRVSGSILRDGQHVELSLMLGETGGVTGVVLDPNGIEPVSGAELTLLNLNDNRPVAYNSSSSLPGELGRFSFDFLKPGDYAVVTFDVQNAGFGQKIFHVTESTMYPDIEVRLRGSGTVNGTVVDGGGNPVNGVQVKITAGADPVGNNGEIHKYAVVTLYTLTDAAGKFRFQGIPEGPFEVYAKSDETEAAGSTTGEITQNGQVVDTVVSLTATGSLRVCVSDFHEQSMPYASVSVKWNPLTLGPGQSLTLNDITDERGECFFDSVPVGVLAVSAVDPAGFRAGAETVTLSSQGEMLQVNLHAPKRSAVFGSVSLADGTPVQGGTVSLTADNTCETAITAIGYRFDGIPCGSFTVTARANGQQQTVESVLTDDPLSGRVDITLAPTGTVTGTLVDRDGNPVVGCPVSLDMKAVLSAVQVSGDDGGFSFSEVPYGQVSLTATDRVSGEKAAGGGVLDEANPQLIVILAFQPLGTVTGTVKDRDGQLLPAPGGRIGFRCEDTTYARSVMVDANGGFQIHFVPMGAYTIHYSDNWGFIADAEGTLSEDSDTVTYNLVLDSYRTVTGSVENQDGTVVSHAFVTLAGESIPQRSTWTDENGMFSFPYVKDGIYRLSATDSSHLHLAVLNLDTGTATADPFVVSLRFSGTIRFMGAVWQDGARTAGAVVSELASGVSDITDPDGTYTLNIPLRDDAHYEFRGVAGTAFPLIGTVERNLTIAENVDGSEINDLDITIEPSASLYGTVMSIGESAPVSGARIELTCRNITRSLYTDSDGNFHFTGLPQGESAHIVVKYGSATVDGGTVTLNGDTEFPPISLDTTLPEVVVLFPTEGSEISLPFTLTVSWSDPETGIDLSQVSLRVNSVEISSSCSLSESGASMEVSTLEHGFRFGDNSIIVTVPNNQGSVSRSRVNFRIAEIPTSVSGTVYRADSSIAETGISLTLIRTDESEIQCATGENGSFRFDSVGFGDYTIKSDLPDVKECILAFGSLSVAQPEMERTLSFYHYGVLTGQVTTAPDMDGLSHPVGTDDAATVSVGAIVDGQFIHLTGLTDDTGQYEVRFIPMGNHDVQATETTGSHFSQVVQVEFHEAFDEKIQDLQYLALGVVAGQVTEPDGTVRTVGHVNFQVKDSGGQQFWTGAADLNETGYRIENVPQGNVHATASVDGRTGIADTEITFDGQAIPLDITLEPDRIVTGRILSQVGNPVSGASVKLESESGNLLSTLETDPDGTFTIHSLQLVRYRVSAQAEVDGVHEFVRSDLFDFTSENSVDLGDLTLSPNTAPTVTVLEVTPPDTVYAGGTVSVHFQASDNEGLDRAVLRSGGVVEASSAVSLYNATTADRTLYVSIPAGVDLTSGDQLTLTVDITDTAGETVTSTPVSVTVIQDTTPPVLTVTVFDNTAPMPEGYEFSEPPVSFNIHYVDPETGVNTVAMHNLTINSEDMTNRFGWYSAQLNVYFDQLESPLQYGENTFSATVTNNAGLSSTISGTFTVGFKYVIEGQVTGTDGNPVGAGHVLTFTAGSLQYTAETDATGHYRLEDVEYWQTYDILSDRKSVTGEWFCVKDTVQVDRDTQLVYKDLQYYEYGHISGTIYRALKREDAPDTKEPYTSLVDIYADEAHGIRYNTFNGQFSFDYLPLANYAVHGWQYGTGPTLEWQTNAEAVTLDATTHEKTDVELFMPVRDRISGVFLDENGVRVSRHNWTVTNADTSAVIYQNSSGAGDNYYLNNVPAGRYRVTTIWTQENLPGTSNDVTVEYDGETFTADVVLEAYRTIAGTALLPDGTTPAAGATVIANAAGHGQSMACDGTGAFLFEHVYNAAFTLSIEHAEGSYAGIGDFTQGAHMEFGTIVLLADRIPTATASADRDTVLQSRALQLTVTGSDDHGIASWGYRLSGVMSSVSSNPVTGSPTTLNESTWIDIPADTEPGELIITAFVVDNADPGQEGGADPITVTVEKRYLDYSGTVYRADGATLAEGATVIGRWFCDSGEGVSENEMTAVTDAVGRFRMANIFDRGSMCWNGSGYTLRIVYNDGNPVEVYKSEHSGTPTADVDELVVLGPPTLPTATLEINPDLPLFMVMGHEKSALLHVTTDWDITGYTWNVTGMFDDMGEEYIDHQSPAFEIRTHCPFDWFPDSIPTTPGTITLTATITDEFGQTAIADPVTIQVAPARAFVNGRLLKSDGTPATGGEILLTLDISSPWGEPIYDPDTFYTVTETDGTFQFTNILKLDRFRFEEVEHDEHGHPTALVTNTANLNELTVRGSLLNADFHGSAIHVETVLPSDDLTLGDITLTETDAPIVVPGEPLDGSAAVIGEAISVGVYIKGETDPVSVAARTEWSDTDTVLTDQGEATDFRWGGRAGYHLWTGFVPVPDSPQGWAWFTPLKLTITAIDGTGKSTVETRTLQAFGLGEGDTLPVPRINAVFPNILQSAPVTMPGMILPVHVLDESGNPPDIFRFSAAKYDETDLEGGGSGEGKFKGNPVLRSKGIMNDGLNGYGELQDPDHYAAAQCLRITIQAGSDGYPPLYLVLNVPILDNYEAHPAADLVGDLSGWVDRDIFLTSGTLLIDGDVTFRNLIIATGATIEMSGSAVLTVTKRLVLLPGATLSNINPGGTPKVSVTGTDLFLYGDYTGKGQPDPPFTFTASGGIHEQNN